MSPPIDFNGIKISMKNVFQQSFLGSLKENEKGIREDLQRNFFSFYAAASTRIIQGVDVQKDIHDLVALFAHLQAKGYYTKQTLEEYPFGKSPEHDRAVDAGIECFRVRLIHEAGNIADQYALHVALMPGSLWRGGLAKTASEKKKRWAHFTSDEPMVIGYVPASISRYLYENLKFIHPGDIMKIKSYTLKTTGEKHYYIRVAFPIPNGLSFKDEEDKPKTIEGFRASIIDMD